MKKVHFNELLWEKAHELYRDMPWRRDTSPYAILVSELMLQQTQVDRVIPKFELFLKRFPTVKALADAPLADVLALWSGLGYNRRAKFLHESAKKIMREFRGVFPETYESLISLPGVGVNTAGALLAYSYNKPAVFIETNVRTVLFYHFFPSSELVDDKELRELMGGLIDQEHPREWYWAMMDYGTLLKREGVGQLTKSRHYKKQSPLKGSVREVRGQIIKALTEGSVSEDALRRAIMADDRFEDARDGLLQDGLISRSGEGLQLTR